MKALEVLKSARGRRGMLPCLVVVFALLLVAVLGWARVPEAAFVPGQAGTSRSDPCVLLSRLQPCNHRVTAGCSSAPTCKPALRSCLLPHGSKLCQAPALHKCQLGIFYTTWAREQAAGGCCGG